MLGSRRILGASHSLDNEVMFYTKRDCLAVAKQCGHRGIQNLQVCSHTSSKRVKAIGLRTMPRKLCLASNAARRRNIRVFDNGMI